MKSTSLELIAPRANSLGAPLRCFRNERVPLWSLSQFFLGAPALFYACVGVLNWALSVPSIPPHPIFTAAFVVLGAPIAYWLLRPLFERLRGKAPAVVVTKSEVIWGWAPLLDGARFVEALDLPLWWRLRRVPLENLQAVRYQSNFDIVSLEFISGDVHALPKIPAAGRPIAELIHALAPLSRLYVDDRKERDWSTYFRDHRASRVGILLARTTSPFRPLLLEEPESLLLGASKVGRWGEDLVVRLFAAISALPLLATAYFGLVERRYFLLWLAAVLFGGTWEILVVLLSVKKSDRSDIVFDFRSHEVRSVPPYERDDHDGEAISLERAIAVACAKSRPDESSEHGTTFALYLVLDDGSAVALSASETKRLEVSAAGRQLAKRLAVPYWEYPEPEAPEMPPVDSYASE